MEIYIDSNSLSIKLPNRKYKDVKAHMFFISRFCNFKCIFCKFRNGYVDDSEDKHYSKQFKNYSEEEIIKIIKTLIKENKYFKFSGGEPLMNKQLKFYLETTKKYGGITFLDTNCSLYNELKKLIDNNLIDILGVSLKGTTPDQAKKTTQIFNIDLVWNNVFQSIEYALENSVKYVIITLVLFNHNDKNNLLNFLQNYVDLFIPYSLSDDIWKKLVFKFNNMQVYEQNKNLLSLNNELLKNTLRDLVKINPKLNGKIVLVNNGEAIHEYNSIVFM